MPAPSTVDQFLDLVRKSGLLEEKRLNGYLDQQRAGSTLPATPRHLADQLVRDGLLTRFQADQLLLGKARGFTISGKYRVLEHLGAGGMGTVYLCEHISMRRRLAIKVLPPAKANDESYLARFYREARAVAAVDHPNIVRAYDIDHEDKLHFLVMEYVEGSSLHDIVTKHGPLDPLRAAHYLRQAAEGLQHAHEAGLVHRDIKPGNLLVDRNGVLKILDLGLARFFHDEDNLSKRFDETVLGTADYLAPEQALDSSVDIRADVYSLGATFYFCLTGQTLFGEGQASQKLIWAQMRQPRPLRSLRPEVPEWLAAIIEKMLAKDPAQRYQQPIEVAEALAPWTATPIPPPPEEEMPRLTPALRGSGDSTPPPNPTSKLGWTGPITSARPGPPSPTMVPSGRETIEPPTVRTPGRGTPAGSTASATVPAGMTPGEAAVRDQLPVPPPPEPNTAPPLPEQGRRIATPAGGRNWWSAWVAVGLATALAGAAWASWWLIFNPPRPHNAGQGGGTSGGNGTSHTGPPGTVVITKEEEGLRVKAPGYEAVVGEEGALTSVKVNGVEFLRPGVAVSRGAYLFMPKQGALNLSEIEQPAANVIKASAEQGSVRYEFDTDSIICNLTNDTDTVIPFYVVLSQAVQAVKYSQGGWVKVPAEGIWPTSTWYAGTAKLTISGVPQVHPWDINGVQILERSLPPGKPARVVFRAGTVSDAEAAQVAALPGGQQPSPGNVTLTTEPRRFEGTNYQAMVASDGCLTSLKIGGTEFFKPGVALPEENPPRNYSRGAYFFDAGGSHDVLKLSHIEQPSPNVLTASSDLASIRYQFGPDTLTWTVKNASDHPMLFFITFDPEVSVVRGGQEEWARTPVEKNWPTTTWFAGRSKLTITGGTRIWGPWASGKYQVWEAALDPGQERRIQLEVGTATDKEAAKVAQLTGKPVPPVQKPAQGEVRRFHGKQYEAVVEPDGCLTSLKVNGTEFLWAGGTTSRGTYFFFRQEGRGPLKLTDIQRPAENVLTAGSAEASIRYQFDPDSLTWTLKNASGKQLDFFMVLDVTRVRVVRGPGGEWTKLPVNKEWRSTTWFAGRSRLAISGSTNIWGPWEPSNNQVWDAVLAPGEQRQVVLTPGRATPDEAGQEAALTGTKVASNPELTLSAPLDYQVCQRQTRRRGQVPFRGQVGADCDRVEARLTGESLDGPLPGTWRTLPLQQDRSFAGELPAPAGGWYRAEVRALSGDKEAAQAGVMHVGVGEVFVIAGQSNGTNFGQEKLRTQTGLVASFSGTAWQLGNDPQPGVHDHSTGGSCWPAFGDALVQKYRVPVGIACTGQGGSSVRQWQPGGDLFPWLMRRIGQLGRHGFRAVLWHQGEQDAGLSAQEYARLLGAVIRAARKEAGWDMPWFVAQVSYTSAANPSSPSVRAGQKQLWDRGLALQGPDTDTLRGDNRNGIHLSGKGQRAHGQMWADKVGAYLDKLFASTEGQ